MIFKEHENMKDHNLYNALSSIPEWSQNHSYTSGLNTFFKEYFIKTFLESNLKEGKNGFIELEPVVESLKFPYHKMGAINTLNLFGLDELIIFSYYLMNQKLYKKVADIGANLGLHSIIMSKIGWQVDSFEPDPIHAKIFIKNIKRNKCENVSLKRCAVSNRSGRMDFLRVLGNTTGSHIVGSKKHVYGETEIIKVDVIEFNKIVKHYDFIKLDVEGQEANLICSTASWDWANTDAMVEIGGVENARKIFRHLKEININIFSQKIGWEKVRKISQMPESHKEGSVFISRKNFMNWRK